VGKVLYRLKDIEAYLIRKVFQQRTQADPERVVNCSNDLESVRNSLGGLEDTRSQTASTSQGQADQALGVRFIILNVDTDFWCGNAIEKSDRLNNDGWCNRPN
jgi:hypothetical protein